MLNTGEGILLQRNKETEELYQNMSGIPGTKKNTYQNRG
jgi:hypothetical protein